MAEELQGGREGMASAKDRGGGEMCPHSKPGPLPMAAFLLALLCGDGKLPPFPCANRVNRPPAMCMGPAYGVKKISPMAFQCMFDTSNINFRIATIQFQPPPPRRIVPLFQKRFAHFPSKTLAEFAILASTAGQRFQLRGWKI